jgi:hypothetical protein
MLPMCITYLQAQNCKETFGKKILFFEIFRFEQTFYLFSTFSKMLFFKVLLEIYPLRMHYKQGSFFSINI